MNKEHINTLAKEFLKLQGIDSPSLFDVDSMVFFAEHLIEKGEMIPAATIKFDTQIVDKLMEIDWQGTNEFCEKNNYPVPYYTGEMKSSADLFLGVEAKRWHVAINYAKSVRRGKVIPDINLAKVISDQNINNNNPDKSVCTKPNCSCAEKECARLGTEQIKSYPCLANNENYDTEKVNR